MNKRCHGVTFVTTEPKQAQNRNIWARLTNMVHVMLTFKNVFLCKTLHMKICYNKILSQLDATIINEIKCL